MFTVQIQDEFALTKLFLLIKGREVFIMKSRILSFAVILTFLFTLGIGAAFAQNAPQKKTEKPKVEKKVTTVKHKTAATKGHKKIAKKNNMKSGKKTTMSKKKTSAKGTKIAHKKVGNKKMAKGTKAYHKKMMKKETKKTEKKTTTEKK